MKKGYNPIIPGLNCNADFYCDFKIEGKRKVLQLPNTL